MKNLNEVFGTSLMSPLKEYLTENNFFKNLGIGMRPQIELWLEKYKVKEYTINDDLTIDLYSICINTYPDEYLPEYIRFNNVFTIELHNCPKLKSLVFPSRLNNLIVDNCPKFEKIEKNNIGKGECIYRMIFMDCPPLKKSNISKSVKFGNECKQIILSNNEFNNDIANNIVKLYVKYPNHSHWDIEEDDETEITGEKILKYLFDDKDSSFDVLDLIRVDDWIYDELSVIYNMDSFYLGNYIKMHNYGITETIKEIYPKLIKKIKK